jgi:hypothetical protein
VGADLPRVEGAEQRFDAGVDGGQLFPREPAAGQSGLVGYHAEPQAGRAEPIECGPRPRHRLDHPRIAVVRHVDD